LPELDNKKSEGEKPELDKVKLFSLVKLERAHGGCLGTRSR
jgi:hypothetical protein